MNFEHSVAITHHPKKAETATRKPQKRFEDHL